MRSRLFLVMVLGCALAGLALAVALVGPLSAAPTAASVVRPVRPSRLAQDPNGAPAKTLALPNAPGIYGQLMANADPAPDLQVTLHRYKGTEDVAVLTATTSITGFFEFPSPPTPPEGWTYYALFGPNTTDPAYVYAWYGPNVTNYQVGETRDAGVLNIADVPLVAPADNSTVTFPMTFRWTPRPTDTDNYFLVIFDPATGMGVTPDYPLGYSDAITFTSAAQLPGIEANRAYGWGLFIDDGASLAASSGQTFGQRAITFDFTQPSTPTMTSTATGPAVTPTRTPTVGPSRTPTRTATAAPPSATPTHTATPTRTVTAGPATLTPTPSPTSAVSPTVTATRTPAVGDYLLFLPHLAQGADPPTDEKR